MTIGQWVTRYRRKNNLSMRAFGRLCGLSSAYISMLERGINPTTNKPFIPTIQTLQKIAEHTGTDLDTLVSLLDDDQEVTINSGGYYTSSQTAQAAEEARRNNQILFDAAKDLSAEDIEFVVGIIEKLKEKERK